MIHPDIRKYESSINGTGLIAVRAIERGTVLCWTGENDHRLLTKRELRDCPQKHLVYRTGNQFLLYYDGSEYMNHSCDPNTFWLDDDTTIASRDISEGEEITYDYATSEANFWWWSRWECQCGSHNCRKIITGLDCLRPDFIQRHEGHLPSWTVEFIAKNQGWRSRFLRLVYIVLRSVYRLWLKLKYDLMKKTRP